MAEERHINRDQQIIPVRIGHPEIRKEAPLPRHSRVSGSESADTEQNAAGLASAEQLSCGGFYQMGMLRTQCSTAEFATSRHRLLPGELSQLC
jgi:hypothetical protein